MEQTDQIIALSTEPPQQSLPTQLESSLPPQKPLNESDSCDLNPEFAVICSFIGHFGDKIDVELDIEQLKFSIEDQENLHENLIDLHVKLLKKVRRYFVRDQWEKALIKFALEYSYEDACEIECYGYQRTRPSVKLELLRRLLDAQFECDQKFKAAINLCEANELRLLPLGRDIKGNTYWQRTDNDVNLRIFQEQPLNYKSWTSICTNNEQLGNLIEELDKIKDERVKGEPLTEPYHPLPEIFPELFNVEEKPKETEIETNSRQNGRPKKGGRGTRGRTKKPSPLSILREADEEDTPTDTLKNHDNNNLLENGNLKHNIHSATVQQSDIDFHSDSRCVESQVKSTLECIISKVVSSFEYLVWPLSTKQEPATTQDEPTTKTTKGAQSRGKKQPRKKEKTLPEELPRRSSSRIQQLQLKKIAEQEEEMKKMIEANSKKSSFEPSADEDSKSRSSFTKTKWDRSDSPDEGSKSGRRRRKHGQTWRRGKGKKKLSWDKDDSDLSSTSSVTESNDDNDDDLDDIDESLQFGANNYDDEFACEEEETNTEPVIIKRARTANESAIIEEDKPCGRCDKSNDPEWILLCDMCDDGYHASCCLPPLMIVPDGDWYCPFCEHKMLLGKLRELHSSMTEKLEAKERERIKRLKLRQNNAKKESVKTEQLPAKRPRDILNDLNDKIAVQELDNDLSDTSSAYRRERIQVRRRGHTKRSKRRSRYEDDEGYSISKRSKFTYSRRNMSDSDESNDESTGHLTDSSEDVKPKTRRARASVSYKFQEYDELIKSAIQGDDESFGEEDKEIPEQEPPRQNYSRGKDMATIEALAYQQENGLLEPNPTIDQEELEILPKDQGKKNKKRGRRLNDLDDDSELEAATSDESFQASSATEVEDEEEEMMTEVDSEDESSFDEIVPTNRMRSKRKGKKGRRRDDYESDGSDYQPRTSRRAAAKKISYKESSEDEDEVLADTSKKSKRVALLSDEESEASWKGSQKSVQLENEDDDDDDRSTSVECPQEVLDSKIEEDLSEIEAAIEQEQNNAISVPVDQVPESAPKKVKLEKREPSILEARPLLDESIDEIVAPLLSQKVHVQSSHLVIKPKKGSILESAILGSSTTSEKARDPIQELNQYCSDNAQNPTTMFSSFNQTLSTTSNLIPSSPPHPKFYEEEEVPDTSLEAKQKKTKKSKAVNSNNKPPLKNKLPPRQAIEKPATVSAKVTPPVVVASNNGTKTHASPVPQSVPPPLPPSTKLPEMTRLPSSPISRPMMTSSPQRYPPNMSPQVYPQMPSGPPPMTPYTRLPDKFSPQMSPMAPRAPSQMHQQQYLNYERSMANFMSQPRPRLPINHPYANTHLQATAAASLWNQSGNVMSRPTAHQSIPTMYYPSGAAPMPNPNFSIQQLLGNPYSVPGLATSTAPPLPTTMSNMSASQPPPTISTSIQGSVGGGSSQLTPISTQSTSSSDNPTIDNCANTDKDMIRGMSDVISFIGDT